MKTISGNQTFEEWFAEFPMPEGMDREGAARMAWQEGVRQGREQVLAEAARWLIGECTGARYVGGGEVELRFTKVVNDARPLR